MKFPKRVKHRGRVLAMIYGKSESYSLYRVAWSVNGKRRMKAFERFGGDDGANQYAEKLVKDLARGSQTTALTSAQAIDALAAIERLQSFYQVTGRRISLLAAVSEYADAACKLNGHSLGEALDGYLRTVATVKRKLICEGPQRCSSKAERKKPNRRMGNDRSFHRVTRTRSPRGFGSSPERFLAASFRISLRNI